MHAVAVPWDTIRNAVAVAIQHFGLWSHDLLKQTGYWLHGRALEVMDMSAWAASVAKQLLRQVLRKLLLSLLPELAEGARPGLAVYSRDFVAPRRYFVIPRCLAYPDACLSAGMVVSMPKRYALVCELVHHVLQVTPDAVTRVDVRGPGVPSGTFRQYIILRDSSPVDSPGPQVSSTRPSSSSHCLSPEPLAMSSSNDNANNSNNQTNDQFLSVQRSRTSNKEGGYRPYTSGPNNGDTTFAQLQRIIARNRAVAAAKRRVAPPPDPDGDHNMQGKDVPTVPAYLKHARPLPNDDPSQEPGASAQAPFLSMPPGVF
ncbi:hypothetical protein PYCCODRAFT_1429274, partial [Trametes coccinea BRFM310]